MHNPCQLVGIFARSPELIRATRDFDRGRCGREELERVRRKDVKRLVEYQKEFEYVTDGGFLWQDLLRPFTMVKGIEEGPLTRFFKTNTFYRRLVIKDRIEFKPEFIEGFLYLDLLPERRKVNLPGSISFLSLSEDRYRKDTPFMIAEALASLSEYLENRGVLSVQFLEPGITSTTNFELWRKVYGIITENLSIETSIHTYFTDFSEIAEVIEFPVDGIGIDFISTSIDDLELNVQKKTCLCEALRRGKVGIGYVDAQNSLLETVEEVIEFAKRGIKRLGLKEFYLCPNCDLDFLPYAVALEKLEILNRAAKRLKEE